MALEQYNNHSENLINFQFYDCKQDNKVNDCKQDNKVDVCMNKEIKRRWILKESVEFYDRSNWKKMKLYIARIQT
jgi:hypothetical protein